MDTQRTVGITVGKWIAVTLAATMLAACGGGGDDSGSKSAAGSTPSTSSSSSTSSDTSSSSSNTSSAASPASVSSNTSDASFAGAVQDLISTPAPVTAREEEAQPQTSTANKAPTISGSPTLALNAGSAYSFSPVAQDGDGDALSFSIQNKPSWATFSIATGKLSGTPSAADVSTYSNIVISVSDGKTSTKLPAFAINVTQISNGRVTLNWTPPTQNTDGSALTSLSGYKIVYGTSAGALTQSIQINNAGLTTYVVEDLAPGTWYFAIKAVNSNGTQSDNSGVASKTVS